MADAQAVPWPRPYFKATDQPTKIFFVCFARAPLADVPLSLSRFGLPSADLLARVTMRDHLRSDHPEWFENWWRESFGVIARRDLGDELPLLTGSDTCSTLALELPDSPDLGPQQTVWGLSRWLCARGASVVLDVHAFRFRTRTQVEALGFDGPDTRRDVKLVFETNATQGPLHLMHTRGLCKFARPELLCFIRADDVDVLERIMNQVAKALIEGAAAEQIRLRVADGVELVAATSADPTLVATLGLERAVMLGRSDGAPLAGIGRLTTSA